jgi:hypothetical protein
MKAGFWTSQDHRIGGEFSALELTNAKLVACTPLLDSECPPLSEHVLWNLTPPVLPDYTKRPFTKSLKESILAAKSF